MLNVAYFKLVVTYLKKIQKIYKSSDTCLEFYWHQHFFTGNQHFCYSKKQRYRFHFTTEFLILLTFFESWKIFLITMVANLMISEKLTTLGFLKIKVFWNKDYVNDVTNKILLQELNHIVFYLFTYLFEFFNQHQPDGKNNNYKLTVKWYKLY